MPPERMLRWHAVPRQAYRFAWESAWETAWAPADSGIGLGGSSIGLGGSGVISLASEASGSGMEAESPKDQTGISIFDDGLDDGARALGGAGGVGDARAAVAAADADPSTGARPASVLGSSPFGPRARSRARTAKQNFGFGRRQDGARVRALLPLVFPASGRAPRFLLYVITNHTQDSAVVGSSVFCPLLSEITNFRVIGVFIQWRSAWWRAAAWRPRTGLR